MVRRGHSRRAGNPEDHANQPYPTRRTSIESAAWYRVPSDSTAVVEAQTIDELKAVERHLVTATELIMWLTARVASSREVGIPVGYVHPERQVE